MPLYFYKILTLICVFAKQKEIQKGSSSLFKKKSSLFYPISAYKRCHMNALLPDAWVSLYLLKRSENRYPNKRAFWWLGNKESAWKHRSCRRRRLHPWVRRIPWRKEWLSTPVFLPGKFHGLRSLAGDSPWGRRAGHDWSDLAHANKNLLKNVPNSNTDNS